MTTPVKKDAARDWRGFGDAILAALCLVGIAVVTFLLLRAPSASRVIEDGEPVATLRFAAGDVRRRPQGSLVWERLGVGDVARDGDAVFVPPAAQASFHCVDGSTLEVEADSLFVMEGQGERRGLALDLVRGRLQGAAATELRVKMRGTSAVVPQGGVVRLQPTEAGANVDVLVGRASIEAAGRRIETQASVEIDATGRVTPRLPPAVTLLQPAQGARLTVTALPAQVALTASAPGRVQVAREPSFTAVLSDGEAPGPLSVALPSAGAYVWRVVDAQGVALSETRSFVVLLDVAPRLLEPASGEVLTAGARNGVAMRWTEVPGATGYEVQLARDPAFANLTSAHTAQREWQHLPQNLGEARYYWRVRALLDGAPGRFSDVRAFRVIDKPLPATPELLDAQLEVSR